ncbi:MAG TPA: hypothetical protein VF681_03385 [Abditibacteriaceae bacterium]|jgi:hypothetical protein
MPNTLQNFLAQSTQKAALDLEAALGRLPADKRDWSAGCDARSALDMVAECAILNGSTAEIVRNRAFPANFDMAAYAVEKAALARDETALLALLKANTARTVETLSAIGDDDLEIEVQMPWGAMTLAQVAAYPYWNMSYHEGQINFIASLLGCLK